MLFSRSKHVEFISFTIFIHSSSQDNSVYFSVQLTYLQKKLSLSRVYYFLINHIEKERDLKKSFFEKIEFLLHAGFTKGWFFFKNRWLYMIFCVHIYKDSRIYTSIDGGKEEATENRVSTRFFLKLKLSYSSLCYETRWRSWSRYFRGQFKFLRAVL